METMWIADHRLTRLRSAGLATFDQVMATTAGQCKRVLGDRENWYLPGHEGDEGLSTQYSVVSTRIAVADHGMPSSTAAAAHNFSPGFYLKKHRQRTWRTRLASPLRIAAPRSPGRIEAENAIALNSLGIAVMPLTAYGEKLHADGRMESFLLSEELEGYCELQDFIEQRFNVSGTLRVPMGCPLAGRGTRSVPNTLHRLIVQVADIARRFHAAGFNHRDFYCCHFLVKEASPGQFDVCLIDLQRVERRRWFRRRWIVKDLAQLASMSPDAHVGCREKVLFLRTYLGVTKLRPHDKRLVRAVLRKLAAIRRHTCPTRKRVGVTA
jgi:hypothetical protein